MLVCLEFILNSHKVFSCSEIHVINIYSGSKVIYCTCAYKLPKNLLFCSNPFVAKGSVALIQAFGTQVRDEERFLDYRSACRSFCPSVQHWWVLVSVFPELVKACSTYEEPITKTSEWVQGPFSFWNVLEFYFVYISNVLQLSLTHHCSRA